MAYHMRRKDKEISDRAELAEILEETRYVTVALCRENVPYLVSLSHAYDGERGCLYFHSASEGRKLDYMRANPRVWGQAIMDHGYVEGKCNHLYATVMFGGRVEFAEDPAEKRRILRYMFNSQERRPGSAGQSPAGKAETDPHMIRIGDDLELRKTTVGRIVIEELTGKRSV